MNKKAFIHHPIVLAFVAFLLGMLLMFLLCKNWLPVGFSIC